MKKKALTRAGAALLAGVMLATSAGTAFAASSANNNNTDVDNDLDNSDIIDTSLPGSLTIYKYDMTAASEAHAYNTEGSVDATGKSDSVLEEALANYAIAGVEFTYLRVGNIEQYSYTDEDGTQVNLVYEVPEELAEILGLDEDDAVDMQAFNDKDGDGVKDADEEYLLSNPCDNDELHYTSDQINEALENILTSDNIAAKDALEEYVEAEATAGNAVHMKDTDENGYTYADNLELGLYLIVETEVPENVTDTVDPFFVSIPMTNETSYSYKIVDGEVVYLDEAGNEVSSKEDAAVIDDGGESWFYDITVYPKNQTGNPTLDKLVRNATGDAAEEAGKSEDLNYIVSNLTDMFETYGSQTDSTSVAEFVADRGDSVYSTTVKDDTKENTSDGTTTETTDGKTVATQETSVGEYQYASTTTASAGDVIDYILVSKIPHITSESTYLTQYTFTDILSAGLTYNKDVKIAFYDNKEDAYINNTYDAVDVWTIQYDSYSGVAYDSNKYVEVYDGPSSDGSTRLTVSFTDGTGSNTGNGLEYINKNYSDYYMVVYYTATVDSDDSLVLGDEGNDNNVSLTWSRTSEGWYDTLEDKCIVYAYGLDLTKYFSDGNGTYGDVTFNMYNQTDGYYVVAKYNEDDKVYYVTGKSTTQMSEPDSDGNSTVFTVNSDGKILIYGLEGDSYSITELSTTSGYALLADQIVVDINSASKSIQAAVAGWTGQVDENGKLVKGDNISGKIAMVEGAVNVGTATVDGVPATLLSDGDSTNAIVSMTITNTKNFTLPLTGGAGLYIVTIMGVLAVAGGCWMAFGRKKEDKNMMAA